MVYIDDYNSIERLDYTDALSHISVHKRKLKVLAVKSESVFGQVQSLAAEINMKVNEKKTQLLCISASKNNVVKSYIRTDSGNEIESSKNSRLLFQ